MFRFAGSGPTVNITFSDSASRPKKQVKLPGTIESYEDQYVYGGNETVSGTAEVIVPPGKKMEHLGIKVEMVGHIELYFDRGNNIKFTTLVRELEPAGILTQNKTYAFDFSTEKPYETYSGMNVRLRYFLRVTVTRSYNGTYTKEQDFLVQNTQAIAADPETPQSPLKMEVGIEDCLHIEFEYDRQKYHLQDVVLGKIYFLLVRIKIKHMELAVIRRETAGSGSNTYNESENITKFELMDGAPVKGECIPIRLYLKPLTSMTPTYRSVNNVFSVKYYLNLVLIDEEDRRYFKQQEIILWRKDA
jgi:vacuolar protein sorting-associated protein 26